MSSLVDITNISNQSDIASHWLPSAVASTIMDPNEPEPLMKLPISIEHDSLQYDTSVLIDSAPTLNFVSQEFLIRNGLVGKCVRGPKIEVRIANEQRISTNKSFSPTGLFIHQNSSRASPLLCCHTSNVWTLSLGYQRSKHYKCLFNLLIILL